MALQGLRIYNSSAHISDEVANLVSGWESFHRQTLGVQIVRAADSISNNIAEGYARTSTGERLQFLMYADGSLSETRNCLRRSLGRGLVDASKHTELQRHLFRLSVGIVEFANALLNADPSYNGPFRLRINKRREWLVARRSQNSE